MSQHPFQNIIDSCNTILNNEELSLDYKFYMLNLLYNRIHGFQSTFKKIKKSFIINGLNSIKNSFFNSDCITTKAQAFNNLTTNFYPLILQHEIHFQDTYKQLEKDMLLDFNELEHAGHDLPHLVEGVHPLEGYLSKVPSNAPCTNSAK